RSVAWPGRRRRRRGTRRRRSFVRFGPCWRRNGGRSRSSAERSSQVGSRSRLRALRLRRPAVAYSDLRPLRRRAVATRVVRIVLAVAIAGLLAGAVVAATQAGRSRSEIIPETQGNVVVIDVSKSIIDREFAMI